MLANTGALVKLLSDDDPETFRLVKQQLVSLAEEDPECLHDLLQEDDVRVSAHVREVVCEAKRRAALADFSLFCHLGGEAFDIERAAWTLARAVDPKLCTDEYEEQINAWGHELLTRIPQAVSNVGRVNLLSALLSDELGFRGNSRSYYCEANSLLPCVISSRMGNPISLVLIYMIVGSRAAMKIEGINLPGHFIARHGEVFFDPFHGGRILCRCDVQRILARQGLTFKESHLHTANSRQFLLRMLANLLYVYDLDAECRKHDRVKTWMEAIVCATA